jgi:hypothetical protein
MSLEHLEFPIRYEVEPPMAVTQARIGDHVDGGLLCHTLT